MNLRPGNSQDMAFNRARSSVMSAFMSRVYSWMMMGILVTAAVSYGVGSKPALVADIVSNQVFFWALIIAQFGSVIFLSAMINRISAPAAAITFLMYSALTGLTLSVIFVVYTQASITTAFATTAIAFGGLSMFGYVTKRDLGPVGSFCIMGLFGLIGITLLSLFIPSMRSDSMQIIYSVVALIIFSGLTAYDTQRIKAFANSGTNLGQMAILGALTLYLDFLNIFVSLLRLMGDRR